MALDDNSFVLFAGKTCSPASAPLCLWDSQGLVWLSIPVPALPGRKQQGSPLRNPSQRKKVFHLQPGLSLPGAPLVASGSFFTKVCFKLAVGLNVPSPQDGELACLLWPQFPQLCQGGAQPGVKSVPGWGTVAEKGWEAVLFFNWCCMNSENQIGRAHV